VKELRQRNVLSLDQAHALVGLASLRERVEQPAYAPTDADAQVARVAIQQLEAAVMAPPAASVPTGGFAPVAPPRVEEALPIEVVPPPSASRAGGLRGLLAIIGLVVVLAGGAWWFLARDGGDAALQRGIAAYERGDRAAARSAFADAARDDPKSALPHIYLGRMAREEGDAQTAVRELEMAIRIEPASALAQREMAAHLLAARNYDLARRFYIRAIELDPNDRTAQGFLGCTLIRMGRVPEGMRFLQRAGQGSWSTCAQSMMPVSPPPVPPTQ
jgi:tetratricopeptide (TPR) repeat protein